MEDKPRTVYAEELERGRHIQVIVRGPADHAVVEAIERWAAASRARLAKVEVTAEEPRQDGVGGEG